MLLLLAHVEGGSAVKAAADHHAGDGGLDRCAAVPAEAFLTVPVLPGGSFLSSVLDVEKTRVTAWRGKEGHRPPVPVPMPGFCELDAYMHS